MDYREQYRLTLKCERVTETSLAKPITIKSAVRFLHLALPILQDNELRGRIYSMELRLLAKWRRLKGGAVA